MITTIIMMVCFLLSQASLCVCLAHVLVWLALWLAYIIWSVVVSKNCVGQCGCSWQLKYDVICRPSVGYTFKLRSRNAAVCAQPINDVALTPSSLISAVHIPSHILTCCVAAVLLVFTKCASQHAPNTFATFRWFCTFLFTRGKRLAY